MPPGGVGIGSVRFLCNCHARSEVFDQPQCVVHGSVHVPAGDRVADSHQLELACFVANQLLRSTFHQGPVVDCAEVALPQFQLEVQLGERLRAMVGDHMIDVAY